MGGKVFRNLAGCCCDQKGGQFWFPLQGVQSELCMAEDEFFPKYETEKKNPSSFSDKSFSVTLLWQISALHGCSV